MEAYTFVGVDVSAKKVDVCTQEPGAARHHFTVENTPASHRQLLRRLTRHKTPVRVCLESTGVYGLDLAIALAGAPDVEMMIVNPRAAKRYAEAQLRRSKTDRIDASILCSFAQTVEQFQPWKPPTKRVMELRALSRRIGQLVDERAREKNRLHAAESTDHLRIVRRDHEVQIRHLNRRIALLVKRVVRLIAKDSDLERRFELLLSVPGVAELSAVRLLGELCVLPADLTVRQWVAHAGLDPRAFESGTSVRKKARISKKGNRILRAVLFMPAHNLALWNPQARAAKQRLRDRGKTEMQAKVAIMRKLLHAIFGMFRNNTTFDGELCFGSINLQKAA